MYARTAAEGVCKTNEHGKHYHETVVEARFYVAEASDLVDALSVATEDLRYRSELEEDYEDSDRAEMLAKAARIDVIFEQFVKAFSDAAGEQTLALSAS